MTTSKSITEELGRMVRRLAAAARWVIRRAIAALARFAALVEQNRKIRSSVIHPVLIGRHPAEMSFVNTGLRVAENLSARQVLRR